MKTEAMDSKMPDMEQIDWEEYDNVIHDNEFKYDRPPEQKLELNEDTEKLHRVRIVKAPDYVDEDGVVHVEVWFWAFCIYNVVNLELFYVKKGITVIYVNLRDLTGLVDFSFWGKNL